MKNMKKILVLSLAALLLVAVSVGGTMAWLSAASTPVTNEFTTSTIGVTVTETTSDYKMVPGTTIDKDPVVTADIGDVKNAIVFLVVEEGGNLDTFIDYEIKWEGDPYWMGLGEGATKSVYYTTVGSSNDTDGDGKVEIQVLKDDEVTVKKTVTMTDMQNAENNPPTLEFTAYIMQSDVMSDMDTRTIWNTYFASSAGFTVDETFQIVDNATNP